MKTYQILNKNDILQEGDECLCEGTYFRPVIEKEYRILEQEEASLPTDEWWSPDYGWVEAGSCDNTSIRRRLVKAIDWKAADTAPSAGLDLNRIKQPQSELLSQNSDLKRRLENALSDKILLHANLSDRNAAINRLKAVIEDKNATIRRLSEKLEAVVVAAENRIKSLEASVEQLKEHRKTQEEEFEVVAKALLADNQLYRRVIDKLTQDVQEL